MFRILYPLTLIVAISSFVLHNQDNVLTRQKRQDEPTTSPQSTNIAKENSRCNNALLEKVMQDSIGDDVKQSKLKVMEEAEKALGGTFNVICAQGDFSYITSTRIYCLTGNSNVNCYAFLSDSSSANLKTTR